MSLPVLPGVAFAEVNWSRVIARCPAPYCRGAEQLQPWQHEIRCQEPGCGVRAEVVWPDNLEDIGRVLMMRPDPMTRNWQPGETVLQLLQENIWHGITPVTTPELGCAESQLVLQVEDNGTVDVRTTRELLQLSSVIERAELTGGK